MALMDSSPCSLSKVESKLVMLMSQIVLYFFIYLSSMGKSTFKVTPTFHIMQSIEGL